MKPSKTLRGDKQETPSRTPLLTLDGPAADTVQALLAQRQELEERLSLALRMVAPKDATGFDLKTLTFYRED